MLKQSLSLLALLFAIATPHAFAQPGVNASTRTDKAVQEAVASGKKTRVILRYRAGARNRVATWLNAGKQKMRGEARSLNTVALEIPASLPPRGRVREGPRAPPA